MNAQRRSLYQGTALKCVYIFKGLHINLLTITGRMFLWKWVLYHLLWKLEFSLKKHPLPLISHGLSFSGNILHTGNALSLRLCSVGCLPSLAIRRRGLCVVFFNYLKVVWKLTLQLPYVTFVLTFVGSDKNSVMLFPLCFGL